MKARVKSLTQILTHEKIEHINASNEGFIQRVMLKDGTTIEGIKNMKFGQSIDVEKIDNNAYFAYTSKNGLKGIQYKARWLELQSRTITIEGKDIEISEESYQALKKSLL